MEIGVPKKTKEREFRVGLTSNSVGASSGKHQVFIETGAGIGSGFSDRQYEQTELKLSPTQRQL